MTPLERAALPPVFCSIPITSRGIQQFSVYGAYGLYSHVFECHMAKFGNISKYQFANLLGCRRVHNIYRYFTGACRPSPLLLGRLLALDLLFDAGIELHRIQYIDWEPDPIIIHWKNGNESSPSPLSGRWEQIPTPETGDGRQQPHGAFGKYRGPRPGNELGPTP